MSERHFTKLELLVAWNKRPLVDKFIDNGLSGFYIQKWINQNGLTISAPTVYKYMKLKSEAMKKGIPVAKIISDKRKKRIGNQKPKIVKDIESGKDPSKKGQPFNNPTNEDRIRNNFNVDHVKSESEIIDFMLDKGYQQLKKTDGLDVTVTKQIIELLNLKSKMSHTGLTEYGKQVIRMERQAMENVVTSVLMDYVPEEKYQEIIDKINAETTDVIKKIKEAQK